MPKVHADVDKLDSSEAVEKLAQSVFVQKQSHRPRPRLTSDTRVDHLMAALEITLIQQIIKLPNPSFQ